MELVTYEQIKHLVIVKMNDPSRRNCLSDQMLEELRQAWERYENDTNAWIAVLAGEGPIFCSGADKSNFKRWINGTDILQEYADAISKDLLFRGEMTKPVISAINGPALGGGLDLALRGDIRIMSEDAYLRLPEADLGGVFVTWEGLPYSVAAELVVGLPITAKRAYEIGLVSRVVPATEVMNCALSMAEEILKKPPLAIAENIRVLNTLKRKTLPMTRPEMIQMTADCGNVLQKTEDWKNSMAAFLEKKQPVYQGR